MYINTHTYYSFKFGTMDARELLEEARKNGVDTLALTDINSTAASLNFVRIAPEFQIKPILGIDFRNGARQLFIGIARNNEGFKELNDYLSGYLHRKEPIPPEAPFFKNAFVAYPFSTYSGQPLKANEYLGVRPEDLGKLRFSQWMGRQDKLVVLQTATFRNKRDFNAHRLLRAIDNNTLLSKLPKSEEGRQSDCLLPVDVLLQHYREFPAIIANTRRLLDDCHIHFEFGDQYPHKNQTAYTGSEAGDYQLIKKLCAEGLHYRYEKPTVEIHQRLESELDIIQKKGFVSYFLINWDIVRYARRKDYFYVGRGSGANSIVAYLLNITDVDPIELDLYFERFINLYRKNPPDFDIDFSWRDREDITRYIFDTFPNTALLATYSTFQYRSVVRELGKVFGLPPHEIDRLSEKNSKAQDQLASLVLRYGKLIADFPSHLSIHAGGILISEKPIHYYTATDLPPKGFPTTHFDMVIAEDVGLYKFDILSQRGLGKIKDSLELIAKNQPDAAPFDIHDVKRFKKDEKVKALLRTGQAIGCFYVESPAMRMLLKKLEVDDYLGLVAASSIIRPGVAKSGMMREYILRFRNPERRKDAHPIMLDIMPDTFGVMVYQEDVIKVAHFFAGLSLAEADMLRRGMSGKFRSREEFQKVRDKYFVCCREKGHDPQLAAEVWRQIESFAGYAFSKGHSASYAVESYQSLFLKAHFPLEYMVSVLNNGGGFYRPELYVHEARMHGANIEPPCVNTSDGLCTIEGTSIYLGLGFVKDLEQKLIEDLLAERSRSGHYRDLADFVDRVSVSLTQLGPLIRVGAFRFTGKSKKALAWEAHLLLGNQKKSQPSRQLFGVKPRTYTLPPLYSDPREDAFDELELLGFPLCDPFTLLRDGLDKPVLTMRKIPGFLGKTVTMPGYLVTVKTARTVQDKNMYFGTFLDSEGYFIDTVHFPPVAARFPFRGKGIYRITGKVVEEFGFYSIEVTALEKMPFIDDPRYVETE